MKLRRSMHVLISSAVNHWNQFTTRIRYVIVHQHLLHLGPLTNQEPKPIHTRLKSYELVILFFYYFDNMSKLYCHTHLSSYLGVHSQNIFHSGLKVCGWVITLQCHNMKMWSWCDKEWSREEWDAYHRNITVVRITVICRLVSVIGFIEYLINWSEKVHPGLQLSLRVVSFSFCQNESYVFALWRHVVIVWAAE